MSGSIKIIASKEDKRYIQELWKHILQVKREYGDFVWYDPLYVEENNLQSAPDILICGISINFLSKVTPLLNDFILFTKDSGVVIPFLISHCEWDCWPYPFEHISPLSSEYVAGKYKSQRDALYLYCSKRLRIVLNEVK